MTEFITLPWPAKELNPNARLNHWEKTKYIRDARTVGMVAAKEIDLQLPALGELDLGLFLYPPDHRQRDVDNVLASLKSYLDGIFQAAGADDSRITKVMIFREKPDKQYPGGAVVVNLSKGKRQ